MNYSDSGEASRRLALMMKTVTLSTNFAEKGAKPLLRFSHLQINRHDSVGILLIFISRNPGKLFLKNFSFLIISVSKFIPAK